MSVRLHDLAGNHYGNAGIPTNGATDATAVVSTWTAPFKCKITAIEYVSPVAVTGAATNNRHLNIQLAAGTEIANLDLESGTNPAVGKTAFTLSGTAAQLALAEGDVLLIQNEKNGTGLALGPATIRFTYVSN